MISRRKVIKISGAMATMGLSLNPAYAWLTGQPEKQFLEMFLLLDPELPEQSPLCRLKKTALMF